MMSHFVRPGFSIPKRTQLNYVRTFQNIHEWISRNLLHIATALAPNCLKLMTKPRKVSICIYHGEFLGSTSFIFLKMAELFSPIISLYEKLCSDGYWRHFWIGLTYENQQFRWLSNDKKTNLNKLIPDSLEKMKSF